jgi:hypothetical protein
MRLNMRKLEIAKGESDIQLVAQNPSQNSAKPPIG